MPIIHSGMLSGARGRWINDRMWAMLTLFRQFLYRGLQNAGRSQDLVIR
jgi:hypothetical protein